MTANDDNIMTQSGGVTHAYWKFLSHKETLKVCIKSNPDKKEDQIIDYLTTLLTACNEDRYLQEVILSEYSRTTGIKSTGYDGFYKNTTEGERRRRIKIERPRALALSIIALQTEIDMQYDTMRGMEDYLVNEDMFNQDFRRKVDAFYTVQLLKKNPRKQFSDEKSDELQTRMMHDVPSVVVSGEIILPGDKYELMHQQDEIRETPQPIHTPIQEDLEEMVRHHRNILNLFN